MGRAAFFIRLFGCPVHCPWCDSAGTWHSGYVPKNIEKMSVASLVGEAKGCGAEFVVITGGEPAIHDLTELTEALKEMGLAVHIETSGGFELKGHFDWITLSPKWQQLPLAETLICASELKLIVEDEFSIEKWANKLGDSVVDRPIWLHPEWSQRSNAKVLESITQWVKEHGAPYRVGYQMHKLYKADLLDPKSRKSVPLGGDEAKGY